MHIRTYHELTEPDRSGLAAQIMAQRRRVAQRLAFGGPEAGSSVWRGAGEAAALREFVGDVTWGALDVLFVDLPPGLARFQELAELLPAAPAVLTVTIPTAESGDAVRRALRAALERGARPLGIVENMVGGAFVGVAGDTLAREFGTPLLARVPWHPTPDVWHQLAETIWNAV